MTRMDTIDNATMGFPQQRDGNAFMNSVAETAFVATAGPATTSSMLEAFVSWNNLGAACLMGQQPPPPPSSPCPSSSSSSSPPPSTSCCVSSNNHNGSILSGAELCFQRCLVKLEATARSVAAPSWEQGKVSSSSSSLPAFLSSLINKFASTSAPATPTTTSPASSAAPFAFDAVPSPSPPSTASSISPEYILRGEYDEGMNTYSTALSLDAAVAPGSAITIVAATVCYNLGQLSLRKQNHQDTTSHPNHRQINGSNNGSNDEEDAFHYFSRALELVDPIVVTDNNNNGNHNSMIKLMVMIASLHNLGRLQYLRGQNTIATRTFTKALRHLEGAMESITSNARRRTTLAKALHHLEGAMNSTTNESRRRRTIATATMRAPNLTQQQYQQQQHGELTMALAATHNCLGVVFLRQSNQKQAMEHFQRSLALYNSKNPATGNIVTTDRAAARTRRCSIATVLNNIGRTHFMKGYYDMALSLYCQALDIRRSLFGDCHLDVAAVLYNCGQAHHQKGYANGNNHSDWDEALRCYRGFLAIAERLLAPPQHRYSDVAVALRCMGKIHQERKEYHIAHELFQDALNTQRMTLGEGSEFHPEIANTFNKLGNLLYEMGDSPAAIRAYQQGLAVERAVLHPFHPNIAITLSNIGQIYNETGEYRSALPLFKEAIRIQRFTLGPHHPELSVSLSAIGHIHHETQNYAAALEFYQDALWIHRRVHGNDNLEVATLLNSTGLVLLKLERPILAMESLLESLRIRRLQPSENQREVATLLFNIGSICLERGQDDEALDYYRQSLQVEKCASSSSSYSPCCSYSSETAVTMMHIGQLHQERGELDVALRYYSETLELYQQRRIIPALPDGENVNINGNNYRQQQFQEEDIHSAIAKILSHIGNVYLQQGKSAQMVTAFSSAARHLKLAAGLRGQGFEAEHRDDEVMPTASSLQWYGLSKLHPGCAAVA